MEDYNFKSNIFVIVYCMKFQKDYSTTVAFKNICIGYTDTVKACKYQRLFKRFKNGDYDISCKLKDNPLWMKNFWKKFIESDPCQNARDLAQKINVSCATVHEHLEQIGKPCKEGIWILY